MPSVVATAALILPPFFGSGSIHAALKKDPGGIRPIVVADIFRRLVGKCFAFTMSPQAATFLNPSQLGVGTRGGCEIILHAAQAILDDSNISAKSKCCLQVDFSMAFQSIDRSILFNTVRENLPGLAAFVEWAYGAATPLYFHENVILSTKGVHQGDPLGPLLFALVLQPLILRINENVPDLLLNTWFLDDGTLMGEQQDIFSALSIIRETSPEYGLILNEAKSCFWRPPSIRNEPIIIPLGNVPVSQEDGLEMLGAAVGSPNFCTQIVEKRVLKLEAILSLLTSLEDPHIQYVLLRSCLGLPKFMYCLRTTDPATAMQLYQRLDIAQCATLASCIGAAFSTADPQWNLASIAVSLGGFGIRSAAAHAPAAFVASILQTESMVGRVLAPLTSRKDPSSALSLLSNATARATTPPPSSLDASVTQNLLSRRVDESRRATLLSLDHNPRLKVIIASTQLPLSLEK